MDSREVQTLLKKSKENADLLDSHEKSITELTRRFTREFKEYVENTEHRM